MYCLGAFARVNAAFGEGISNSPIVYNSVKCTGLEHRLSDCPKIDLILVASHSCGHSRDAGVECIAGIDINLCLKYGI